MRVYLHVASFDNDKRAPDINTSYPGHIYNFDAGSQTCEVQLAIENLFVGYANAYILQPKQRLIGVPVQFIQGGGWSLTHPVPDGTPCYVHFSQRGIDHWMAENKDSAGLNPDGQPSPSFSQLFSHNAAVCTIGTQPLTKVIPSFQDSSFEMRNADRSQRLTFLPSGTINLLAGSAFIAIAKDGAINIQSPTEIKATAPKITLDGDTTVTKSLTVMNGMSVNAGTASQAATFSGNFVHTGSYTLNGVRVDGHTHLGHGSGNDTGPMK